VSGMDRTIHQGLESEICEDPARWDAYVMSAPSASNYHRWRWREVIEKTFGHKAFYLAALENREIRGILPLVQMKSNLFGHFLVSMPFFSSGGVLTDTLGARNSLLVKATALAQRLGVSHIELRQEGTERIGWEDTTARVTMEVVLPDSVEAFWNRLSPGMRNKVRNARKNDFRVEWGGVEAVADFYRIFSLSMRNFGTPVYPQNWFLNLCRGFPGEVRVLTLWDGNKAVASGIVSCFRDRVELPWSASLPESRKTYAALFLYWTLLEWAIQNNYRLVDFGRCSKGGGVYEFKRHWATQERQLHWHYWLAPDASLPQLRPENPRFRMATNVWKHLPLRIANLVGPRIVRSIP
jgi:serine/alanine adding enzyme